jgi:hypothetical protein
MDNRGIGVRYFSFLANVQTQPHIQLATRLLAWEKSGKGIKVTIHFQLVPCLKMSNLYLHFPVRLNSVMLN